MFTLGVGVNNASARLFTSLAATGLKQFSAIPRPGSIATDDLAYATEEDTLIAITSSPYRTEVVEAVQIAREQGLTIVAVTDSPASPIALVADHVLIVTADSPQFFPSSLGVVALLETLLSFVVAVADEKIIARVDRFHHRRHQLGIYTPEGP